MVDNLIEELSILQMHQIKVKWCLGHKLGLVWMDFCGSRGCLVGIIFLGFLECIFLIFLGFVGFGLVELEVIKFWVCCDSFDCNHVSFWCTDK